MSPLSARHREKAADVNVKVTVEHTHNRALTNCVILYNEKWLIFFGGRVMASKQPEGA
jgi:hypothetical protein